jgi:hypothetical protein
MRGGTASTWANRWFDKHGTDTSLGSFSDSCQELEATFQDKDLQQ